MELAFATGRGPAVLSDIEGLRPLVCDEDVVAFGRRDADEADEAGSRRIEDTPIPTIELTEVRALGIAEAAQQAVAHLDRPELPGVWIHLDADVLDDAIMPAVITGCLEDCRGTSWSRFYARRSVRAGHWEWVSRFSIQRPIRTVRSSKGSWMPSSSA